MRTFISALPFFMTYSYGWPLIAKYLWVGCDCVQVGPVTGGGHVAAGGARMVRLERGIRTKADHKAVAPATQHVVDLRLGKVHSLHLHDSQSRCL